MDRLRQNDPETIGPYKLIARLGAGGMGVVFLGTKGVERVAIKVVRHSFLDDPALNARFQREIETLTRIDSPHVARIVDSSIDGDFAWHAVEFINGPTLRELIDTNGPLPEDDWWKLAEQLGNTLSAVHSPGIIHRDIKPANIIMSDTGPKIIDFGIAHDDDATSLTTTGAVAGSPAWLSPEQLEGTDITPGSDLYSLGSVLVFAATGRSPWGDETSMSVPVVYQKILSGQPNLDGLSARQKTLIEALQNSDPSTRSLPENWRQRRPVETKTIPHTETKTAAKQPSPPPPSAKTKPNHPSTKKLLRGEEFNPQEQTALARIKFRLRGHPELIPGAIVVLLILSLIGASIIETRESGNITSTSAEDAVVSPQEVLLETGPLVVAKEVQRVSLVTEETRPRACGYGLLALFLAPDTENVVVIDCERSGSDNGQAFLFTLDPEDLSLVSKVGIEGSEDVQWMTVHAISDDGRFVVHNRRIDGDTERCLIVEVPSGKEAIEASSTSSGEKQETLGYYSPVRCTSAFSPNGNLLYFTDFPEVRAGAMRTKNLTSKLEEAPLLIEGVAPSHLRPFTVTDDYLIAYKANESALGVFRLADGQEVKSLEVEEKGPQAFSGNTDGKTLFFATTEDSEPYQTRLGILRALNLETLEIDLTVQTSKARAKAIAFSPDGQLVAIGHSVKGGVTLVDVPSGQVVQVIEGRRDGGIGGSDHVTFSRDGKRLYVAGWDNITVFEIDNSHSNRQ